MSRAAPALTRRLLDAAARRVAFLGLAKNAGKTTALVATLEQLHHLGILAGATSAGRDGEDFDALTGEPKPRFRLFPGQLVASASTTLESAALSTSRLSGLPFATRFGPIELARVETEGEIEVMGPATASQTAAAASALEDAGARIVLLDGAFGRRAFASARVADGVVLSVGMSAGRTIDAVLERARLAAELIALARPREGARVRAVEGALTEERLREISPADGETLQAEDFAAIFLSGETRRQLVLRGVSLAVARPARLLAVTSNPSAPGRPAVEAAHLFDRLRAVLPGVPVYDLKADLVADAD